MSEENHLSNYVSNVDRDIYSVYNLPEEVIATVFAYVSRSPKSFRDNLLKVTEDKAKQFHEKWVLNYGHASVAELATVHIGIEKVSRLFSAVLERANLYISPIEYSQRYQKPKRGDIYIPTELLESKHETLKEGYINYQNEIYDDYLKIFEALLEYHKKNIPPDIDEGEKAYHTRLEKLSFEDARYVLTLAVYTNLGLTANARAMEDTLIKLLSSEYSEVRQRGEEIKKEVTESLPTLVKYANESHFLTETRNIINQHLNPSFQKEKTTTINSVMLTHFTGEEDENPEETALNIILAETYYSFENLNMKQSRGKVAEIPYEKKKELFNKLLSPFGSHDNPPPSFEKIIYEAEFLISESCWHQFLRHRKVDFNWQYPTTTNGYIIPPHVKAVCEELFIESMNKSFKMSEKLNEVSNLVSHYAVTNAHYRRVAGSFSLWELYHLINLRMTPQAQWEIKLMIEDLVEQVSKYHDSLIQPALERLRRRL